MSFFAHSNKRTAILRLIPAFALALVLSGCSHYYVHPEKKTTAEFNKDKRECEKIADREAARNGTKPCDEVEKCLITSKGWKRS
jgi:hypothetical protein